jgi:hypothetical protein
MLGSFYAPDTIPEPIVPGTPTGSALQQAMMSQAAPLLVPDKLPEMQQNIPPGINKLWKSFLQARARVRGRPQASLDPMDDMARFRSQAQAKGDLPFDTPYKDGDKYKRFPTPLERPEWWLPTPPEWGAPSQHMQSAQYGPAQVPSPILPGAPSVSPNLMPMAVLGMLQHDAAVASFLQRHGVGKEWLRGCLGLEGRCAYHRQE